MALTLRPGRAGDLYLAHIGDDADAALPLLQLDRRQLEHELQEALAKRRRRLP